MKSLRTLTLTIACLLSMQCAPWVLADEVKSGASSPTEAPRTTRSVLVLPDFSTLVRQQGPTVVHVRVFRSRSNDTDENSVHPGKQLLVPPRETGMGSGFVVAPNGVILTNRHVVDGADKLTVRFFDKRELPARVLGVDPLTDVAVLKVEAQNLPIASLGDSSRLEVGQWVLAIGAPLGLERTATQGIISALGRALPNDSYVPFIQTDVPINPGNSGGPLFDLDGHVVGINSQIVSKSGGYMGLSFAIPINTAVAVAKQILEQGHVTHGWLGIGAQELTLELAQAFGLDAPRGALVTELRPSGPAEQAGLQPGDVILALDNFAVIDSSDLPPIIGASLPGTEHVLAVLREGKIMQIRVKVGDLKDAGGGKRTAPRVEIARLAIKVSNLDAATMQVMGLRGGVLIEEIAPGAASLTGVQPGDLLLKLGATEIQNAEQLRDLVGNLPIGKPIPLLVRRQDNTTFVSLILPEQAAPPKPSGIP